MEGKESKAQDARKVIDALGYGEEEETQSEVINVEPEEPEAGNDESEESEVKSEPELLIAGKESGKELEPEAAPKKKRGRKKKNPESPKVEKPPESPKVEPDAPPAEPSKPLVVRAVTDFRTVINGCQKKYSQGQIEGDYITAKFLLESGCPVAVMGSGEFQQCPNCKHIYK